MRSAFPAANGAARSRKEGLYVNEKTMIRDLTVGNTLKSLLQFSLPFVLANLLQQVYNMADMVIVGQFVGSAGLAAASAGGELAAIFLFFSMGVAASAQVVIAQHIGAGERGALKRSIGTAFSLIFLMAVFFMVVSLLVVDYGISLLNVPPEAVGYTHDYAVTYFCGMIPVYGYNVVSSILRGMGDSKRPFFFIAIAVVLNIVLDLIFVGLLKLACFGAALATVISQTVSFLISIIYLVRRREAFGFDFRRESFRIDRKELSSIMRLGIPLTIQHVAISISMFFVNSYINSYGLVAAATTGIGNKITMIMTIGTNALAMAGNTIIAQNFAARKFRRVSETLGWILLIGVAFAALLSILMLIFPEAIFAIFDTNPDVLAMAHVYAPIAVISFFGFATRASGIALVNGIGFSSFSFVSGFIDGIVARIGFSMLFGLTLAMGVRGFWLGNALAGHVIGIMVAVYYFTGKWKERKLLV